MWNGAVWYGVPNSENGAVWYGVLDSETCTIPWSLRLQSTSSFSTVGFGSRVWHAPEKRSMGSVGEKKTEVWHALKKRSICIHKLGRITKTLEQLHSSHKKEFHHFQRTVFFSSCIFFPWVRQTYATPLSNMKTMNRVAMNRSLTCAKQLRMGGRMVLVEEGRGGRVEWHCTLFKTRTLVSYEALDSRVRVGDNVMDGSLFWSVIKGKTSYIWKWSIRSIQQWRRPSHCGKLGWICYHPFHFNNSVLSFLRTVEGWHA